MAGTRLLISLTALIQVVGIIVMAIYAGLCQKDDMLCRPFQRSQATLALPPPLAQTTLDMPPLIVATADSQVVFWKQIVHAVKLPDDQVTVQAVASARLLEQVCRQTGDMDDAATRTGVDIFVCESNEPRFTARLRQAKDAASIFYPRSLTLRQEDWKRLYPPQTNSPRMQLEWTLQLASDIEQEDFDSMVQAANAWWQDHDSHGSWPCVLQRPVLRVQVAPEAWEASLREIVETMTSTTSLDDNVTMTTTTTRWEMPLDSLNEMLLRPAKSVKNRLVSILHVTQKPLQFVDHEGEQSTFASAGATRVAILDMTNDDLDAVLTHLYQSTFLYCMGHEDDEESTMELISNDRNTYPPWLVKLWYQRTLRQLYSQAVETVHQTHKQLVHPPSWKMAIPTALMDQYNEAVDLLEQCQGLVQEERYAQALDHLDRAMILLEKIGKSPDLLEPLDFPPEQYAAILAPLALPLLLPLLKGTVSEVMRYRRLRRAKIV